MTVAEGRADTSPSARPPSQGPRQGPRAARRTHRLVGRVFQAPCVPSTSRRPRRPRHSPVWRRLRWQRAASGATPAATREAVAPCAGAPRARSAAEGRPCAPGPVLNGSPSLIAAGLLGASVATAETSSWVRPGRRPRRGGPEEARKRSPPPLLQALPSSYQDRAKHSSGTAGIAPPLCWRLGPRPLPPPDSPGGQARMVADPSESRAGWPYTGRGRRPTRRRR